MWSDGPTLVNRSGRGGGGDDDDGGGDGGEDGQDDDDNDECDQMGVGLLALLAIGCASVESLLPASVTSVPPVPVLVPVSVPPVIVQILVCISTSVICHITKVTLPRSKLQSMVQGIRFKVDGYS